MKTLLLRNNVIDVNTLNKGIEIIKNDLATINIPIEFISLDIVKQFTSVPFSNEVNKNGYRIDPTEIFLVAKDLGLSFDVVCLVYDWNMVIPHCTNPDNSGRSMQIPIEWYVTYPEVFAEYFLHELCHFFYQGNGLPDRTHAYNALFSQKPRKDWYLFLLGTLYTPEIPEVTLTRRSDDGVETLGDLVYKDFSCKTLERPWKENLKDISCIPKGKYLCKYRFFTKGLTFHYQIMDVLNRTGIFMHAGNYFFDIGGCILLGSGYANLNSDKETDIVNSKQTVKKFEDLMQKKDFWLIIN